MGQHNFDLIDSEETPGTSMSALSEEEITVSRSYHLVLD